MLTGLAELSAALLPPPQLASQAHWECSALPCWAGSLPYQCLLKKFLACFQYHHGQEEWSGNALKMFPWRSHHYLTWLQSEQLWWFCLAYLTGFCNAGDDWNTKFVQYFPWGRMLFQVSSHVHTWRGDCSSWTLLAVLAEMSPVTWPSILKKW